MTFMSKGIAAAMVLMLAGCNQQPSQPPSSNDSWLNDWKNQPQNAAPMWKDRTPPKEQPKEQPKETLNVPDVPQKPAMDLGQPEETKKLSPKTERLLEALNPPIRQPQHIAAEAEPKELAEAQSQDIPANWTGAVVYHAKWCQACPALVVALTNQKEHGWTSGDGNNVHFKFVDFDKRAVNLPLITNLPTVVYFKNGQEIDRVVGFSGTETELTTILAKHPKVSKASVKSALTSTYEVAPMTIVESPIYSAPLYVAPMVVGPPVCRGPGCGVGASVNLFGLRMGGCIGGRCQ
jgi:thiol-disulfide isomerase/thioredoxin